MVEVLVFCVCGFNFKENPMNSEPPNSEYPHWNRVYLAVIVVTVAVIAALWLFSKSFE